MKITVTQLASRELQVGFEHCGGERCGNCEPSCEQCCERCGHLEPVGTELSGPVTTVKSALSALR
jgi:hypothetical protein